MAQVSTSYLSAENIKMKTKLNEVSSLYFDEILYELWCELLRETWDKLIIVELLYWITPDYSPFMVITKGKQLLIYEMQTIFNQK